MGEQHSSEQHSSEQHSSDRRSSERDSRRHKPGMLERIETITTPLDRPPTAASFGSGVIAPGTSRYQRLSAHLPSGVTRFQGLGVLPADVAVDLTSEEPTVDLHD